MEILFISLDMTVIKDYSFPNSGEDSTAVDLVVVVVVATGILFTGQKVET